MNVGFPQLESSAYLVNRDGLKNTVVILDEQLIFRYANHELARQTLHREAMLLEMIQRHVAVQVPRQGALPGAPYRALVADAGFSAQ